MTGIHDRLSSPSSPRLLLDMGADPNSFGTEYTGRRKEDNKRRRELWAKKVELAADMVQVGRGGVMWQSHRLNGQPTALDRVRARHIGYIVQHALDHADLLQPPPLPLN